MRGRTLLQYATEWVVEIEDITGFVREQAALAGSVENRKDLLAPRAV